MTNPEKLFADELIEWLIELGFIQSKFNMSIYYRYAPYGKKNMLCYLMLMIVSIGIHLKLLQNGLWKL